jgi:hypothetical protein
MSRYAHPKNFGTAFTKRRQGRHQGLNARKPSRMISTVRMQEETKKVSESCFQTRKCPSLLHINDDQGCRGRIDAECALPITWDVPLVVLHRLRRRPRRLKMFRARQVNEPIFVLDPEVRIAAILSGLTDTRTLHDGCVDLHCNSSKENVLERLRTHKSGGKEAFAVADMTRPYLFSDHVCMP